MLEYLDRQTKLTGNQYRLLTVAILCNLLEFYDFFLVSFVLAFVAGPWKLTYGQSAVMLLSSGVGAIVGAGVWGCLADRIGRRPVIMAALINFSLASGILALTPDKGWIFLTVFRCFVGFGVGGLYCVVLPLVQEFIPAAKRGLLSGLVTAAVPLGLGVGAVLGAYWGNVLGWRGLFALGVLPLFLVFLIRAWVPESPRWLLHAGRVNDARNSVAWALQVSPQEIELPPARVELAQKIRWREQLHYPRSLALSWFGNLAGQTAIYALSLWVPTLFAQVLRITPARAAYLMIYCSLSGFGGRLAFSYLSDAIGRRVAGGLYGFGGAALVIAAGYFHNDFWQTVSVFWLLTVIAYFFADGGFAIVGPYAAEVWPSRLRASGMGAAYGFGGIGKIIGPLGLALIVGSADIIKPEATIAKIVPAFIYIASWLALAGIIYGFFGIETKGRSIEQIDAELERAGPGPKHQWQKYTNTQQGPRDEYSSGSDQPFERRMETIDEQ